MKNILQDTKDFKIIPNNFKSSAECELISINDDNFKIKLVLIDKNEINDYNKGEIVEVFGVNNVGLIYFETTIQNKEDNILTLTLTPDYSVIQRREYSRVKLAQGKLIFKDLPEDIVKEILDISAGGIKFTCKQALSIDKTYDIQILLSNNMKIDCGLQPIRVNKNDDTYTISAKFTNLENTDRVVLIQYAFKIKMEEQNKAS